MTESDTKIADYTSELQTLTRVTYFSTLLNFVKEVYQDDPYENSNFYCRIKNIKAVKRNSAVPGLVKSLMKGAKAKWPGGGSETIV